MLLRYLGNLQHSWLTEHALGEEQLPKAEAEAARLKLILGELCLLAQIAEPELHPVDRDDILCGAIPLLRRDPVLIFAPSATPLLSDEQLRSILAHELGHVEQMRSDPVNMLLSNTASAICWLVRMTPPAWHQEFDADAFAAELVGRERYRRTLRSIADCVDDEIACATHPPLSKRLERLL